MTSPLLESEGFGRGMMAGELKVGTDVGGCTIESRLLS
jgi:hypothetical protein